MLRRLQLVWKVIGIFLVILVCVLGISGWVTNVMYERAALTSARNVSRNSSDLILHNVRELMRGRHPGGLGAMIDRLATDNPLYRDIRLVSHADGALVGRASQSGSVDDIGSWPCTVCHKPSGVVFDSSVESFEEVIAFDDGERVVSVVTPVLREEGCTDQECHSTSGDLPVLGMLQADFSLRSVDNLTAQRNLQTIIAILVSLILGTIATWWMMDRLVGRRIAVLREGAKRISHKDLAFRFKDDKGDGIAELSGVFDNMTSELSDTLTELTSTKEYLEGIVESSADIIITVDPNGLIKTFNAGAERVLGYSRQEVIGERIEMLFADPRERDFAIAQLEHDDHVINYETHFKTWDGEIRNVILTLSRLVTPDGTPIGTFGISKDITEEKALQRQLLQSERLVAIGQAVTGIQHSIKNMLNYAKDLRPDLEATDLGQLVDKISAVVGKTATEEGIRFTTEVASDLPLVRCDEGLIHSVIMDLVSNAIDTCLVQVYGEGDGPVVAVVLSHPLRSEHVVIEVRDNGEGMTEDVRKHIFTPFFSTKKQLGTGMGLTVTARMVSAHGGLIKVESSPGCGSAFQVLLPIDGPKD